MWHFHTVIWRYGCVSSHRFSPLECLECELLSCILQQISNKCRYTKNSQPLSALQAVTVRSIKRKWRGRGWRELQRKAIIGNIQIFAAYIDSICTLWAQIDVFHSLLNMILTAIALRKDGGFASLSTFVPVREIPIIHCPLSTFKFSTTGLILSCRGDTHTSGRQRFVLQHSQSLTSQRVSLNSQLWPGQNTCIPANKEELPEHPEPPHGHQETSDSHAFTETHHYPSFGKAFS